VGTGEVRWNADTFRGSDRFGDFGLTGLSPVEERIVDFDELPRYGRETRGGAGDHLDARIE